MKTNKESNEASNLIEKDILIESNMMNRIMGPIKIDTSKLEKLKNMNFCIKNQNQEIDIDYNINDTYETNEDYSNNFLINRKRKNEEAFELEDKSNNDKKESINKNGIKDFLIYDVGKNKNEPDDDEKINYDYVK